MLQYTFGTPASLPSIAEMQLQDAPILLVQCGTDPDIENLERLLIFGVSAEAACLDHLQLHGCIQPAEAVTLTVIVTDKCCVDYCCGVGCVCVCVLSSLPRAKASHWCQSSQQGGTGTTKLAHPR